ncbi:Phosphatidylglycerophosphatase A [hydrothermal vent metagenome]|uniref:Phosphatidylglycerophosphatase A n=1 Tax=hydrothermal vent metagenome TaxID=652676 RepID=A0A3B0XHV0_9ZZZZ
MKSTKKIPISYLKNPLHFISVGFGTGLMPKAPGTFGTLAAIPLYFAMSDLSLWSYLLITALVTVAGIYLCAYTSNALGVHDHGGIVIDEIAGYLITMIAVPFDWLWMIVGFLLFRFFDILKPWPISWIDKHVHGGLGIMLDDVLAGVFSLICLQAVIVFI